MKKQIYLSYLPIMFSLCPSSVSCQYQRYLP